MRLVYGQDSAVAAWTAERIPHVRGGGFGPCAAIGVANGDRLLAGVVYHDYQPDCGTVQISMAAVNPRWAKREIIAGLLAYPFLQMGCYKVWTAIPADNALAIRVNIHIGFTREAVLAHHFGKDRHCVICRMTKPAFERRFFDGQKSAVRTSRA